MPACVSFPCDTQEGPRGMLPNPNPVPIFRGGISPASGIRNPFPSPITPDTTAPIPPPPHLTAIATQPQAASSSSSSIPAAPLSPPHLSASPITPSWRTPSWRERKAHALTPSSLSNSTSKAAALLQGLWRDLPYWAWLLCCCVSGFSKGQEGKGVPACVLQAHGVASSSPPKQKQQGSTGKGGDIDLAGSSSSCAFARCNSVAEASHATANVSVALPLGACCLALPLFNMILRFKAASC